LVDKGGINPISSACNATGRIVYPLGNDSDPDPDGNIISITNVVRTSGDTLVSSWNASSVTFDMNLFGGVSVFSYAISDGNEGAANATITLTGTTVARRC
jgi:hypothetical protein